MGRLDEKDERDVVFLFLDDDQTLSVRINILNLFILFKYIYFI